MEKERYSVSVIFICFKNYFEESDLHYMEQD